MDKTERLLKYSAIKQSISPYSESNIELGITNYVLASYNSAKIGEFNEEAHAVEEVLTKNVLPTDIETIVELFEALLEQDTKDENGIVFTPKYISDYIVSSVLENVNDINRSFSVVDPACGCGIFLVSMPASIKSCFTAS